MLFNNDWLSLVDSYEKIASFYYIYTKCNVHIFTMWLKLIFRLRHKQCVDIKLF